MGQPQTTLYKDTITTLNTGWAELVRLYGIGDTRVSYLKQFEMILSQNCPGKMLWNFSCYKELERINPLPKDQRMKIDPNVFMNYMMIYEQVMREVGLIDKDPVETVKEEVKEEQTIPLYDLDEDDDELDEFFKNAATPGAVWLTSGFKGGGKSHTAIAVAEKMVKGSFPSLGNVVVATNIMFYHNECGQIIEETPENVHSITTMKELFPIVVEAIDKYGREEVTILLILDEAQNFIGGDSNFSNASVMMKEFLGIIRKFRMMVWFLTPSAQSIGPSFRNFLNDEKYPGNLTARWKKDLALNAEYIADNRLRYKEKELMLVKNFDREPIFIRVPVTEWTKTQDTIEDGEYCYDHEASATFYVGEDFNWEEFNRAIGGVSSNKAIQRIRDFYQQNASPETKEMDPKEKKKIDGMTFAVRARYKDPTRSWEKIAGDIGVSKSTIMDWKKKMGIKEDLSDPFSQSVIQVCPKKRSSSRESGRSGEGGSPRDIYISTEEQRGSPIEENSTSAFDRENDAANAAESTEDRTEEEVSEDARIGGVPDGRYEFSELKRAVDYCVGSDVRNEEE